MENTATNPLFADIHHVAYLRKRLWTRRTTGRAAVMIGAGFSRNSTPHVAGARPFPLWRQLVELLFDGLRPGHLDLKERKELIDQAASGAGALTMAMEYEATFGRSALDNLIISAIPDDEHSPGELHHLLLSLPWADIFTVNYDTLLERARAQVYNRRYEVVVHLSDLPTTTQPRIIKLHGSLPATKPLIFTEEDFRRYPRQFAPFVNTVQQGMMENDFVLLGFSGDDPNFLAWLGWIRDELLIVRPQVYLCGVLDLTSAKRLVLEKRGVTPIDLGTLFTKADYPDNEAQRRSDAIQWFLQSLENGRTALVPLSWPRFPHLEEETSSSKQKNIGTLKISPLLPESPNYVVEEHFLRASDEETIDIKLRGLIDCWELNRKAYPGWLVLPRANRESVVALTKNWRRQLINWIKALPLEEQLRPLAELAWRLERAFLIFDSKVEAKLFQQVVKKMAIPNKPQEREQWTVIAFYLLRQYRYTYSHKSFSKLLAQLEPVAAASTAYQAHRCWEAATERLEHLDADGARKWLNRWPDVLDNPSWDLRRAGLWAELDEIAAAERYAAQALSIARARQLAGQVRVDMLSIEEAATWRLQQIHEQKRYDNGYNDSADDAPRARPTDWDRQLLFKEYNCDTDELGELYDIVKGPVPFFQPAVYEDINPYTGYRSYGRRMATMYSIEWVQPALDVPAIFEDNGQPMRMDSATFRELPAAVKWLSDTVPLRALGIIIRTLDSELLDLFLDRSRIVSISENSLLALLEPALATIEVLLSSNEREHNHRERNNAKIALRLIGRCAFRLKDEWRNQIIQLASRVWENWPRGLTRHPHHDWRLYEEFTSGIIDIMTQEEILGMLPVLLLSAPEPEFASGPFEHINPQLLTLGQAPINIHASVTTLLSWLARDEAHHRSAVRRLFFLHTLVWLNESEKQEFGRILWASAKETGIPEVDNRHHVWRLLASPAPEGIDVTKRVKQYLLAFAKRTTAEVDSESPSRFLIRSERNLRSFLNKGLRKQTRLEGLLAE